MPSGFGWMPSVSVRTAILLDHGIRQGKIPKWLSEEAVIETKSQIAELGPRPGQGFQPGARYIWLKETWLPFLLAKREELTRTQASKLLKIDQEAREEAEQAKLEAELKMLRKQIPVEEPEQFFVKARELRKKSRDVLQPSWRLKKQSLRWVPKNSVNAEEGTSVPEAAELVQEKGFDDGEKVFSSTSVAGLSPEGEQVHAPWVCR